MALKVFALLAVLTSSLAASTVALQGDWRGTSLCRQKNTPCHDENVVLHFSAPDASGTVAIEADKIVGGEPQNMGTIVVKYDKTRGVLRSDYSDRLWEFHLDGARMHGTLTFQGKLFRKLELRKD